MIDIFKYTKKTVTDLIVALRLVLGRWDSKTVFLLSTLIYFLVYIFSVGDLAYSSSSNFSVLVSENLMSVIFRSMGYFSFEPVLRIQVFNFLYFFSPVNAFLRIFLSTLVGLNISFLYLGIKEPSKCSVNYKGMLASVPALFSGAACCGPILLIVIGVQATSILISLFELLVPISLVLLTVSLILVSKQLISS